MSCLLTQVFELVSIAEIRCNTCTYNTDYDTTTYHWLPHPPPPPLTTSPDLQQQFARQLEGATNPPCPTAWVHPSLFDK